MSDGETKSEGCSTKPKRGWLVKLGYGFVAIQILVLAGSLVKIFHYGGHSRWRDFPWKGSSLQIDDNLVALFFYLIGMSLPALVGITFGLIARRVHPRAKMLVWVGLIVMLACIIATY